MFGFLRTVAAGINRRVGFGAQRTFLYRRSKPEAWSATTANNQWIGWDQLSPERVGRLLDIGPFDVSDGLNRLQRGDRCYTVCVDGRLAHYSWVQRSGSHPILNAGMSVPVGSGEFWIYNCRTEERARGKGIYPATLERIITDHFEEGFGTAWIYTDEENIASQKGILRAGFRLVTTLRAVRVGSHYYRIGRANQGQ